MEIIQSYTPQDFIDFFNKGQFNYLYNYNNIALYKKGDNVLYNGIIYEALKQVQGIQPDTDTTAFVETDSSVDEYVDEDDILNAMAEARGNYNYSFFENDEELLKITFMLLTAHYLSVDLGMRGNENYQGAGGLLMASKSVGSVSASYNIPDYLKNNPFYSFLATTPFGIKYSSYLFGRMTGAVFVVGGATLPY